MFVNDIKGIAWAKKNKKSIKRNYKGDIITGPKILADPSYGTGNTCKNDDGQIEQAVDWSQIKYTDDKHPGFDIRNVEENGKYFILISLPVGTKILRYGDVSGRFTAPVGTPYEKLSLPYVKESVEYHEYEVVADGVVVRCVDAEKGIAAPGFGSTGGAVQYRHVERIGDSLERKALRELDIWGRKVI